MRSVRCVLFAYHEIGYACIEELLALGAPIAALFTHRDNPAEEIWWRSCMELARRHSIPFCFDKIDPSWRERVAAMQPAVIYSFFYRELLPEPIIRLASRGAFNLHASLLPKYRGRSPVNWMIINGECEAGVTLHHMVARADAGDIVAQRAVAISDDDTALTLYRKIVPLAAGVVRENHPAIVAGTAPRRRQDLSEGSYFGGRRPADGRIDWNWPARRICNLVRGVTHPYPGAFCFLGQQQLMVWRGGIAHESGNCGESGLILRVAHDGVEVAAGEGSVLLIRVQLAGEPEGEAAAVFRAAPPVTRLE